MSFKIADYYVI